MSASRSCIFRAPLGDSAFFVRTSAYNSVLPYLHKCNCTRRKIMPLQIPDVVAAYIAAEQIKDAHALASCFSDEGVVHDESHNHCGHAEIQRWKEEADMKYSYTSEPLESSTNENVV